jgi:uncharacterized repeat protein (TIGR03803 family)
MIGTNGAGHLALALATVACMTAPAAASHLTVLYQFTGGADGRSPAGPLRLDADGNLYGATVFGGLGNGVVFRLTPTATPPWKETVLFNFPPRPPFVIPNGGLFADAAAALYGTTFDNNRGFAYRLRPPVN